MSGAFYIDGVLQPDPLPCRLPPELVEAHKAEKAERDERVRVNAARRRAEVAEKEGSEARRLAVNLAKNAARRYRKRPSFLDAIWPDLSLRDPEGILALLDPALPPLHPPWGGNPFGALVTPVNVAGARIYARWMRRFGDRAEYLEAAE